MTDLPRLGLYADLRAALKRDRPMLGPFGADVRPVTIGFARMESVVEMRGYVKDGKWVEEYRRLPDRGPSARQGRKKRLRKASRKSQERARRP